MPIMNTVCGSAQSAPKLIGRRETPSSFPLVIEPPEGYDGLSSATVDAPLNLESGNIRKGVEIAGVVGSFENVIQGQEKTVKAESFPVELVPDRGFQGLTKATVTAPDNLAGENIREGVTIAGVEGTYTGAGDAKFTAYLNGTITEVTASDWGDATSVPANILSYSGKLKKVVMSDRITSVGYSFCRWCRVLTEVILSSSLEKVGESFLNGCKITELELPDSLKTIGGEFLTDNRLTELTIPAKVTSIGSYFMWYNKGLSKVMMKPTTPPTLGSNAFENVSSSLVITVPKGSLDAYKTATNWAAFADRMQEAEE